MAAKCEEQPTGECLDLNGHLHDCPSLELRNVIRNGTKKLYEQKVRGSIVKYSLLDLTGSCTHKLPETIITCTRSSKDQTNRHYSIDGRGTHEPPPSLRSFR